MIVIVDYDVGNIGAVANMLMRIGAPCKMSCDEKDISCADRLILPGNGSFDACIENLRSTGLVPLLEDLVLNNGVPLLGICVGAQILGKRSDEGEQEGLGWLDMQVKRFPDMPNLKVPHMGWNHVIPAMQDHMITKNMEPGSRFYFVHSYHMLPTDPSDVLLSSNYGIEFVAAVARNNIAGVQFHPEKSHRYGKQLLASFAGQP